MKKAALMLAIIMMYLVVISPITVSASDNEFLVDPSTMKIHTDEAASTEEIQNIINKLQKDFTQTKLTNDKRQKVHERIQIANKVLQNRQIINGTDFYIQGEYDANKAKLRQANYIETILDLDEGLTENQIYRVGFTHANFARDKALEEFPSSSDIWVRDAFRHYSWNFVSTSDSSVGKNKTRIATVNHEWGILLLDGIVNYYDSQYSNYINNGSSEYDAANGAFIDATLWITEFKYQMTLICKANYSVFKGFFSKGNIMDLINNVWGRSGPERNPGKTYKESFYIDQNNLVQNEDWVGDYQYNQVWQNEWYTY